VRRIARDPVLRVELETLHVLQKQCLDVVAKLKSKRIKSQVKVDACALLLEVTSFPGGLLAIQCSGVISELCTMLRNGYSAEKRACAEVLSRFAADDECRAAIAEGGSIHTLIHMLRPDNVSSDTQARAAASLALANISSDPLYAERVVELGGTRFLTLQLNAASSAERSAAAVALGNIAVTPHLCEKVGGAKILSPTA